MNLRDKMRNFEAFVSEMRELDEFISRNRGRRGEDLFSKEKAQKMHTQKMQERRVERK